MPSPIWMKPALVGAVAGAVVLAVVGFSVGGWVTSSKAKQMASVQASTQTAAALVPFCTQQAESDPKSMQIIEELKSARTYERDDIVMAAGWATAPGSDRPNRQVAEQCADKMLAPAS